MALRAEHITRQFLRKTGQGNVLPALKETSLRLEAGTLTEITGRSGSGKTTLLNILAGLLTPSSGKVWLGEEDLYALEDGARSRLRNEKIGVIPQGQTGIQSLTVLENVLLPCRMYGGDAPEEAALGLLERLQIADLRDAYPGELSGGELRRMAVARAMIRRPELLLADEPTGDLDDENTHLVLGLLHQAAEDGAAVLLVTHEQEARAYAGRHYRMDGGVLQEI